MVRLYLDTCAIQRPLDILTQTRLRLEAEAILGILRLIEANEVELISSTILELETQRNPVPIRKEHGEQILAHATNIILVNQTVEQRAIYFTQVGIKAMDALHLAAAEYAQVDYFCTCDDRFLRKARSITDLQLKILSPVELVEAIEP